MKKTNQSYKTAQKLFTDLNNSNSLKWVMNKNPAIRDILEIAITENWNELQHEFGLITDPFSVFGCGLSWFLNRIDGNDYSPLRKQIIDTVPTLAYLVPPGMVFMTTPTIPTILGTLHCYLLRSSQPSTREGRRRYWENTERESYTLEQFRKEAQRLVPDEDRIIAYKVSVPWYWDDKQAGILLKGANPGQVEKSAREALFVGRASEYYDSGLLRPCEFRLPRVLACLQKEYTKLEADLQAYAVSDTHDMFDALLMAPDGEKIRSDLEAHKANKDVDIKKLEML